MLGNAYVQPLGESELDSDVGHVVDELALQVAVLVTIVEHPKGGGCFDLERNNGHDNLAFVEVQHGQTRDSFEDDINVLQRFLDLARSDEKWQFVVVVPNSVRIEANLELQLLLRPQRSLRLLNLEDPLLLDLVILQEPVDILLIDIADRHSDELRVAPIWFCHYLSLEVYKGGLEDKLRVDALAFYVGSAVEFY